MSKKPKVAVNRDPFDQKILAKAKRLVDEYRFAFWREDGEYVGQCVEMDIIGVADTVDECIAEARALAVTGVAYLLEKGERPPLPTRDQARSVQINIRLSPDEKRAIEEAAHRGGFRGISDYLRVRGLSVV
jgi:predicted RNase H-like HicB family nuclease